MGLVKIKFYAKGVLGVMWLCLPLSIPLTLIYIVARVKLSTKK